MNRRKALSTMIKVLIVIFAGLILLFVSQSLIGDTTDRTGGVIDSIFGSTKEKVSCSAIQSRCETACFKACDSGGEPTSLTVEHPDKDEKVQCMGSDKHRCMKEWECEC